MRSCLFLGLVLAGCQEFQIDVDEKDPTLPTDTDTDALFDATAPDIVVDPPELDFGSLPPDCVSDPQIVTITNNGDAILDIAGITLRGPDSAAYSLAGGRNGLLPGQSTQVTLDFEAADFISYDRARLEVESNDPDQQLVNVNLFGAGAEDATFEEHHIQEDPSAVDVLWVIDNSGSMSGELTELALSFRTFIVSFESLELDYQIGVVTTDMTAASQSGRLQGPIITPSTLDPVAEFTRQAAQGSSGSGTERGLDAAYAALTAPLINGANQGLLRADANLSVVVVSDEDDGSNRNAISFSNWLETLKPDRSMTSFSGMVGPDGGGGIFQDPACSLFRSDSDATYAPKYHTAMNQTDGVWGDICQFDVNPFLTFLSYVAAGLRYEFPLQHLPVSIGQIEVLVDGVEVDYSAFDGWTYDPADNAITMHGAGVPGPGGAIEIRYPYQTSCD